MAIKVQGTTVIDDSRNIENIGSANLTSLSIGGTAVTATATELNYVDGVTGPIQPQLDNIKAGIAWTLASSNTTASAGDNIAADVSTSPWTLSLPATPSTQDSVTLSVISGDPSINNLTVNGNGNLIYGDPTLVVDVATSPIELTFIYNATEWRIA